MRLQHASRTQDAPPAAELRGWAAAITNLRHDHDPAAFETRKMEIAAALRRLANQLRLTR
jgi:hypothetical protein